MGGGLVGGGGGVGFWGVRDDVNGELKSLEKFTKKNRGGEGREGGGSGEGSGLWGVRVDVNEELKFL